MIRSYSARRRATDEWRLFAIAVGFAIAAGLGLGLMGCDAGMLRIEGIDQPPNRAIAIMDGAVSADPPLDDPTAPPDDTSNGGNPADAGRAPSAPPSADGGSPPDEPPPSDCAGAPAEGICEGAVARWCERGVLAELDCAAFGETCGFVSRIGHHFCTGEPATGPTGGGPRSDDAGAGGPAPGYDAGMPGPDDCHTAIEAEELQITNAERAGRGLPALRCDPGLARAARLHSEEMCTHGLSHTSFDGRTAVDRARAQGVSFRAIGENIAAGQPTPAVVHGDWMGSDGHRANIMSGRFGRIGIGYASCGGRHFWTQDFAD